MSRKQTGTLYQLPDGRWQARVTLADGTRKRLLPFELSEVKTEDQAKAELAKVVAEIQKSSIGSGSATANRRVLAAQAKESCDGWVKLWTTEREERGLTSWALSKGHWENHVRLVLGLKHPRDWTRHDFRKLSRELDRKVRNESITWKTAVNAWGTATKMADDATESKDDAIRCRDDNPAENVRGPYRGAKTARQYLFPSEVSQLLGCAPVPVRWRRMFAVAVYTYCRASELRALTWDDVDVDRGIIRVTKAFDVATGGIKTTKSKCPRTIPVEPALLPLLRAMKAEAGNEGPVLEMPAYRHLSTLLKRWLKAAGITRASLTAKGPSERPIRFHDLRATGITWMAVRGDEPLRIQQRAGHTDFNTTQGYIREADVLREGFGEPFPILPESLLEAQLASANGQDALDDKQTGKVNAWSVGGGDRIRTRSKNANRAENKPNQRISGTANKPVSPRNPVAPNPGQMPPANSGMPPKLVRAALADAVANHKSCLRRVRRSIADET